MNRIRKNKNVYEVLITPYRIGNPDGFSMMLGYWTDDHLKNYRILEFIDLDDAVQESIQHPDVEWQRLIEFHKDIYVELYKIIKSELTDGNFVVDFQPKIMTADELKNTMFDRVKNSGKRFTLNNDLNDIIGYHIVNPWMKNLKEILNLLKSNKKLRIDRSIQGDGFIRLIGNTSIGTNYEIVLWTTMVSHWVRWISMNPNLPNDTKKESYQEILNIQKSMDNNMTIR
jgi:hypothetical protein